MAKQSSKSTTTPKAKGGKAAAIAPKDHQLTSVSGVVTIAAPAVPIIHIDQLASQLGIERRWILDNWVNRETSEGPVPHFRDGHHVFFNLTALDEWSKWRSRRLIESDHKE